MCRCVWGGSVCVGGGGGGVEGVKVCQKENRKIGTTELSIKFIANPHDFV